MHIVALHVLVITSARIVSRSMYKLRVTRELPALGSRESVNLLVVNSTVSSSAISS